MPGMQIHMYGSSGLSLCLCLSKEQLFISPTDLCLSAGCLAQAARKLNLHCNGRGGNAVRDCVTQSDKMHKQSKNLSAMPRKIFTIYFSHCIQLRANSPSSVSSAGGSVQQKFQHKVHRTWRRAPAGSNMPCVSGAPQHWPPTHFSEKQTELGSLQCPFKTPSCPQHTNTGQHNHLHLEALLCKPIDMISQLALGEN